MATVSFNVPEDTKQAFQEAFANDNQDAVIAGLMQQAVEEKKKRQQLRSAAIDALLDFRRQQTPVSDSEIARAREADRP